MIGKITGRGVAPITAKAKRCEPLGPQFPISSTIRQISIQIARLPGTPTGSKASRPLPNQQNSETDIIRQIRDLDRSRVDKQSELKQGQNADSLVSQSTEYREGMETLLCNLADGSSSEREVDNFLIPLLRSRQFGQVNEVYTACKYSLKQGTRHARLENVRIAAFLSYVLPRADFTSSTDDSEILDFIAPLRPPRDTARFRDELKRLRLGADKENRAILIIQRIEQAALSPNSEGFLRGIDSLVSRYQHDALQGLYLRTLKHGTAMNSLSYHHFVEGFLRIGRPELAGRVMNDMQVADVKTEASLWIALLSHAGRMKNIDGVRSLWSKIEHSIELDTKLWTTLIEAFFACGQVDEALTALQSMMKDTSTVPNTVTCNVIVKGLVNHLNPEVALRFVDETALPAGMLPDTITYNLLLRSFLDKGQTAEVTQVAARLRDQNLRDVATYTILLDAPSVVRLSAEKYTNYTQQVLKQMVREGVQPNAYLYSTIIKNLLFPASSNSSQFDRDSSPEITAIRQAEVWLDEMREQNIARTIIIYELLLRAHLRSGDYDGAFKIWETMRRDRVSPDAGAYSTMIQGLAHAQKLSSAVQLFRKSIASGVRRESICLGLLNACAAQANKGAADQVLEIMMAGGLQSRSYAMQQALSRVADKLGCSIPEKLNQ